MAAEIAIEISIIWKFVGPLVLSSPWAETSGTDKTAIIPVNVRTSVLGCILAPKLMILI